MKSKIKILAIEDDPLHEERLAMILEELEYNLIEVLNSPKGVLAMINATNPDLILMDIDLGTDVNGIELTKKINETYDIPTIFITSHADNETFQNAKQTKPYAYIIKPYQKDEIQRCIELSLLHEQEHFIDNNQKSSVPFRHIFVRVNNQLVKINWEDIAFISAYDKYCFIHVEQKKVMVKERLKNIHALLPQSQFMQVHRSFVINIDRVSSFNNDISELYIGEHTIKIGRSFKPELLSKINTIG